MTPITLKEQSVVSKTLIGYDLSPNFPSGVAEEVMGQDSKKYIGELTPWSFNAVTRS